jgi:hypothetical protein
MYSIKQGMEKEYQKLKDRLDIVNSELAMKHMLNGWLINEYKIEKENLIECINKCIDEKN